MRKESDVRIRIYALGGEGHWEEVKNPNDMRF